MKITTIIGFLAVFLLGSLQAKVPEALAESQNDWDRAGETSEIDQTNAALDQLYLAISQQVAKNGDLDWKKLAEQFPVQGKMTLFSLNLRDETGNDIALPKTKPSAEISDDEWQAFLKSNLYADSEWGSVDYTLIDLDQDGMRDLIIDSYVGGTGLYNDTGVVKRMQDRFIIQSENTADDAFVPGALFSVAGRAAKYEDANWLMINGQIYAVKLESTYSESKIFLLRPFSGIAPPVITIRYQHQFNEIYEQQDENLVKVNLSDKEKAAIFAVLNQQEQQRLQIANKPAVPARCPQSVIDNTDEENVAWCGVTASYLEQVACVPVWLDKQCYAGNLIYNDENLLLWLEADTNSTQAQKNREYQLKTARQVFSVQKQYQLADRMTK